MTFHTKIESTTAGNTFVHNGFQSQVDGFMKLGDIKGKFLAAGLIDPEYDELAGGSRTGLIDPEYDELAGGSRAGLIDPEYDELAGGSRADLIDPEYDELAGRSPVGSIRATSTLNDGLGFADDALVHLVNGIIGYELRSNQAINAKEWLAIGSTVDSLGDNTSMGINQMSSDLIDSISSRDMLAAANQLRSDNRF